MAIRTLAQMRATPQPDWIWHGFIIPRGFTLLSAYPKVGKTTLLSHALRGLCQGVEFLDRQMRPVPVLYISEEADTLLAARCDALGFSDEWDIGWVTKEPGLNWKMCLFLMKRWVYLKRNPLIIVDTLARFWDCESENDATQVDHALNPVLELVRNSDASFLGIHHNRKAGGGGGTAVRGSTALTGGVDIIMELTRVGPYDKSNTRRLSCESRFGATPQLLQLQLTEDGYVAEDAEAMELEPTIISVLQTMAEITIGDICTLTGEADTTVRRVVNGLVNRSMVVKLGSGTPRSPHRYSLNHSPELSP